MTDRFRKKDVVQRLARHMGIDEQTPEVWLDVHSDTLSEAFKKGRNVNGIKIAIIYCIKGA